MLSIILSTFNRPDALRIVLDAYTRSAWKDFEIIVADDGSTAETGKLVEDLSRRVFYVLKHAWQPHEGFRLAAVRNLAVRSASGDVFLFTDGDCIPHPRALEVHARRCVPGTALAGGRSLLSLEETASITRGVGSLEPIFERVQRRERSRRLLERLRSIVDERILGKPRPKLRTANASVSREDFESVNGFDERFIGWGYEDEDLARRLRRRGVRIRDGSRESRVLHLFHPVDESHRPDSRGTWNYRYFKTGVFLTRPLQGLRRRQVQDLTLELLGDVPPALAAREPPGASGGRPEASLVFGRPRIAGQRPRGEVVVRVPGGLVVGSRNALLSLLEDALQNRAVLG